MCRFVIGITRCIAPMLDTMVQWLKDKMRYRQFIIILLIALIGCDTSINDKKVGVEINEQTPNQSSVYNNTPTQTSVPTLTEIPDELKAPNHYDDNEEREGKWIMFFDANWQQTNYNSASYYRKIQFKNDKPVGKVQDYYINGNLQWEGYLASDSPKDVLDGNCTWYNVNGTPEKKNCYVNGILNGKETLFFDDGTIKVIRNYKSGTLSGKFIEYFASNKISQSGSYSKDQKVGQWKYYDIDGDYKLTKFMEVRVGAICNDGSRSYSTGRGTCSHHGGVNYWLVETEEVIVGGTGKYATY